MSGPARATPEGLRIDLRVLPDAGRTRLAGVAADADGSLRLKLHVAAPAVEGAANAEALAYLAKNLGLKKRDCAVLRGHSSRRKTVLARGDAAALQKRLDAVLAETA